MISSLSGTVIRKELDFLVCEINGIGYKIFVTPEVSSECTIGETLRLSTFLYVREDQLTLYGFKSDEDLFIFEALLQVSGVGPKMALNIVDTFSGEEIKTAVSKAQTDLFQSVKGIGKKNAQRIIVELQGKFGALEEVDLKGDSYNTDVILALKSLGYSVSEIKTALKQVDSDVDEESQIRDALKYLS